MNNASPNDAPTSQPKINILTPKEKANKSAENQKTPKSEQVTATKSLKGTQRKLGSLEIPENKNRSCSPING